MHPALFTLRILWAAILMSTMVLVGVLAFVRTETDPPDTIVLAVLGVVALSTAVMSRVMLRVGLRQGFAAAKLRIEQTHDPHSALAQYRGAAPTRRVFADRDRALSTAFRVLQTATIIALALSEAVGLMGFVLGVLGFGWPLVAPFFALSVLLILRLFPTEGRAIRALERHHGAALPS